MARYANNRFEEVTTDLLKSLVTDMRVDGRGRLWITSAIGGLFRIDDTGASQPQTVRLTTENGLSSNNIRTVSEDRLGRIYVGTARGVDRISPDTGMVKHYSIADGLASDFVVDSHIVYPVKNETGELREVISFLEDISDRRIAEENLQKSREDRLVELERVRARIATDLHDDIGASLTQIAVLSEVAQTKAKAGNGAAAEPLTKITTVTNELVSTMSDIVWSINPAKDHLSDLIHRMRRFASDVLSAKNIALQFYAPNLDKEVTINTNIRREVFLIFKESINNVVKHSGAEQVRIELAVTDENLTLEISDNGDGFEPEADENRKPNLFSSKDETGGNGVLSMQKRAAEMNGKIEIISASGKGTSVLLSLPLHQTTQTGDDFQK